MNNILFINGQRASIAEENFQRFHGNSIFTTLKLHKGELQHWDLHYNRLKEHTLFFNYILPQEVEILNIISSNISKDRSYKIRVIICPKHYAITIEEFTAYDKDIYNGVSVVVTNQIVHPVLCRFKTGNYFPYELALKEAQAQNAFEGILLDHKGYIADGSKSGLLLYQDKSITKILGGLDSVMAQVVIKKALALGVKIKEERLKPGELDGQLLLTNSLFGLVPVGSPKDDIVKTLIKTFR